MNKRIDTQYYHAGLNEPSASGTLQRVVTKQMIEVAMQRPCSPEDMITITLDAYLSPQQIYLYHESISTLQSLSLFNQIESQLILR